MVLHTDDFADPPRFGNVLRADPARPEWRTGPFPLQLRENLERCLDRAFAGLQMAEEIEARSTW
jgi:hypothetical protein